MQRACNIKNQNYLGILTESIGATFLWIQQTRVQIHLLFLKFCFTLNVHTVIGYVFIKQAAHQVLLFTTLCYSLYELGIVQLRFFMMLIILQREHTRCRFIACHLAKPIIVFYGVKKKAHRRKGGLHGTLIKSGPIGPRGPKRVSSCTQVVVFTLGTLNHLAHV